MGVFIFGIILLAIGGYARFWVGKRRFHRRNGAGIEEFQSYSGALATQGFEKLVGIAGMLFIVLGVVAVAAFLFRPA